MVRHQKIKNTSFMTLAPLLVSMDPATWALGWPMTRAPDSGGPLPVCLLCVATEIYNVNRACELESALSPPKG
jgi:hypothetical protein